MRAIFRNNPAAAAAMRKECCGGMDGWGTRAMSYAHVHATLRLVSVSIESSDQLLLRCIIS